ncbi:hypothetical protein F4808DRAFT_324322 [Astrocystis sublimbata]|nr:hypothetical protein F4808DRAFT_324322 [Astrocystis sublimbata]
MEGLRERDDNYLADVLESLKQENERLTIDNTSLKVENGKLRKACTNLKTKNADLTGKLEESHQHCKELECVANQNATLKEQQQPDTATTKADEGTNDHKPRTMVHWKDDYAALRKRVEKCQKTPQERHGSAIKELRGEVRHLGRPLEARTIALQNKHDECSALLKKLEELAYVLCNMEEDSVDQHSASTAHIRRAVSTGSSVRGT